MTVIQGSICWVKMFLVWATEGRCKVVKTRLKERDTERERGCRVDGEASLPFIHFTLTSFRRRGKKRSALLNPGIISGTLRRELREPQSEEAKPRTRRKVLDVGSATEHDLTEQSGLRAEVS